ncbi:uncharacterized protein METZ01_LOCUS291693, partial [marine metagenome]
TKAIERNKINVSGIQDQLDPHKYSNGILSGGDTVNAHRKQNGSNNQI